MTRFLIDADGVLASFASAYLDILEAQTGRKHALDEVTSWEFKDTVSTATEDAAVWQYIRNTPGVVRGLNAIPGAYSGIRNLRRAGEVVCVTSPQWGTTWAAERHDWLVDIMEFRSRDIVFTSNKALVQGDWLVDDNPVYLEDWLDANGCGQGVLIDQPWNRHVDVGHRFSSLYAFSVSKAATR